MNQRNITILLISMTLAILASSVGYAASDLTLDEAIRTALKTNPQAVISKETATAADAKTREAQSAYYPQLSIGVDWNKGQSFLTAVESIKPTEVTTGSLNLRQTIYDFGRTAGAVDAARYNHKAETEMVAVTGKNLAFRVRVAFYRSLAAEKRVLSVKSSVKDREELFKQSQEFFKEGIRPKIDVVKAEANLYAARTLLSQAENNRENARTELAGIMGLTSIENRILVEPEPVYVSVPDLEKARQEAYLNRAEIKRLTALKDSAEANFKTAKSGYLPVLSGTASIGYADKHFPPDGNIWSVGLNLSIPLFSGFATVEQVKETRSLFRVTEEQLRETKLQINKDVEFAWRAMNEAATRIGSTSKEMEAAKENRLLAEGRYKEGVGNMIEITDAQSLALNGETAHIEAVYDYQIASAGFNWAVGKDESMP